MKKGTTLTLSGLESRRLLDTFADFGVPNIQVSFYYLKKVFGDPLEFEEYARRFESVFIDHGLIYEKVRSEDAQREFLADYAGYVSALDRNVYDCVVCHPQVDYWDSVLESSKQLWPLEDVLPTFEGDIGSVLSQIEYVGVGNKTANNEEEMGYIASQAKRHGTRLHAFGTSSIRVLKKWPFYSANSSSWRTGSRYANTYLYEGQARGLRIYQPTDKSDLAKTDREKRVIRTRLKNMVEARQPELVEKVDWLALIDEDNSWEVDKANLTQWMLYQRDLELDVKGKYWLGEQDIQLLNLRKGELFKTPKVDTQGRSRDDAIMTPREDEAPDEAPREDDIVDAEVVDSVEIVPSSGEPQWGPGTSMSDRAPAPPPPAPVSPLRKERVKKLDARITAPRNCDQCILAQRCHKYEEGNTCAFGLTESYTPADMDDHINEDVGDLLAIQKDRLMQGYMEEKADASGLNKDLTNNMRLYMEMVAMWKQANDQRDTLEVKARGTGILNMFGKKPGQ
jgi:hypothetical protein